MKQISFEVPKEKIPLSDVHVGTPIFVKKNEKLVGMVVKESCGWIIRFGGMTSATGYWDNRNDMLRDAYQNCDYTFFVED